MSGNEKSHKTVGSGETEESSAQLGVDTEENEKPWKYDLINRGMFSRFTFSWMSRLVRYTFRNDLTDPEDSFILPEDCKSANLSRKLEDMWNKKVLMYQEECRKYAESQADGSAIEGKKLKLPRPPKLLPLVAYLFRNIFAVACLFKLCFVAAILTSSAFLLVQIINVIDDFENENEPTVTLGSLEIPYR